MDLLGLLPQFGGLIHTLVAFIAALAIIVTIHEYGHYIVGRWCGIGADVFSLGFGPVVYSRTDKRGTRWQLAALPLGGYVKFKGDADPASATSDASVANLSDTERRATLVGAPLWARTATVAAGPVFNFISAMLILAVMGMVQGVAIDDPVVGVPPQAVEGVDPLLAGDRILSINGQPVATLAEVARIAADLPPAASTDYVVKRDGQQVTLTGPFPFPPVADGIAPQSAAASAGLEPGDMITAVNGRQVQSFNALRDAVGETDGAEVRLTILRDGQSFEQTLQPRRQDIPLASGGFETRWLIGISGGLAFTPELRHPGIVEATGYAATRVGDIITTSLSGMWHMLTGAISTCNLQGPLGIAETSGAAASAGAQSFIGFIAVLSVAVGLMNLFPIPVLDGGHLVFYAIEAVLRRPPSPRVMNVMMTGGMVLILGLMVFALTNDIFCP
ncbi:RIP metalloprotease RseP [Falsirhodobacter sp. alg1]|uniref:RIP metalloprotease RseP n=1 Tax=Falsirhodobacter sp. alg1 TaxID=1472418 RepID=UPI0005EE476D|nr:RIP metalloprotease RseP [Falsirhodobacter sp. alg1]